MQTLSQLLRLALARFLLLPSSAGEGTWAGGGPSPPPAGLAPAQRRSRPGALGRGEGRGEGVTLRHGGAASVRPQAARGRGGSRGRTRGCCCWWRWGGPRLWGGRRESGAPAATRPRGSRHASPRPGAAACPGKRSPPQHSHTHIHRALGARRRMPRYLPPSTFRDTAGRCGLRERKNISTQVLVPGHEHRGQAPSVSEPTAPCSSATVSP